MRTSRATCWPSLVRGPYFLGECSLDVFLGLISSSLRAGHPLPQVTPCPLLNRFMQRPHGLNIVHEESEEDFGLPKVLTEETLESLQYLCVTGPSLPLQVLHHQVLHRRIFSVGVSTAFGIVTRLDMLMVAVKELVGEQYHIDGIGLPLYYRRGREVEMRSPVPTGMPGSST
jgi:hypothetical protein